MARAGLRQTTRRWRPTRRGWAAPTPPPTPKTGPAPRRGPGCGRLLRGADLPHCGAVVARDQHDGIERLLSKLRSEISRRQQLLAAQGFAGLAEQRAATTGAGRLPWMLLLLDGWEGYVAAFENLDYG